MRLRSLFPLLFLAAAAACSTLSGSAQVAVYATATPVIEHNGTSAQTHTYGGNTTSAGSFGLGLGMYGDAHIGPVGLGLDFRGLVAPSAEQVLVGPRVSFGRGAVRPYAEGLLAAFRHKNVYNVVVSDPGAAIVGGVDYAIRPHLDWRVVEVQYIYDAGLSFDPGNPHNSITNISTGLVYRLTGKARR